MYETLLPQGFHDVPFKTLREYLTGKFVKPFRNSARRELLLENLFKLLKEIELSSGTDVFLEMWIDGSFVTSKEEPNDIDIVIMYKAGKSVSPKLTDADKWRSQFRCDIDYFASDSYDIQTFHKQRFGEYGKGIIRVYFREDDNE